MKPIPGIQIEDQPEDAVLACLLCNEAANDGEPGMSAVAQVVRNRLLRPHRYGDTIKEVIMQPWQFSCLNHNAPEREHFLDCAEKEPEAYAIAEELVAQLHSGALADTVDGANAYCTNGLHGTQPLWGHDDADRIAAGHSPSWYSLQAIETGLTRQTGVVGRQTFGVTA